MVPGEFSEGYKQIRHTALM